MKSKLGILLLLIASWGCQRTPDPFEFTLKGKVIGQDTGRIVYSISPRVGDDIVIPFTNGEFEHKSQA
ncbi:MAG: hypothetical protein KAR09_09830 [Bacteroidales bacterium]|nr:hypothetical protein [Bacteroidales bacterium]